MPNQFELRDIPQWFISVFALTYFTGFLIDNLYYSSIGINDLGEIIKLRYIRTGLHFIILFLIVTTPIFFLLLGRTRMVILEQIPIEHPLKPIFALNTILYFGTIYYAVTFAPPGHFDVMGHQYRLVLFFILLSSIVFGYIAFIGAMSRMRNTIINTKDLTDARRAAMLSTVALNNRRGQHILLYATSIYIIFFDYLIFEELTPELFHMLYPSGIFFFLFCFLFAAQLFRIVLRLGPANAYTPAFAKVGLIVIGALGLVVLYYASVAAFAATLFPYLPSAKGGANYKNAPSISVFIDHPTVLKNPAFLPFEGSLGNMVLLYSTSSSFYFGTCGWRTAVEIEKKGPAAILEIKRDEVKYLAINASKPSSKISDCPPLPPATAQPSESSAPPSILTQPPSGAVKDKL